MHLNSTTESLWPTPTLMICVEDSNQFDRDLARIILHEEAKILGKSTPTEVAGVKGGLSAYWRNYNVLNWNYPEVKEFRKLILDGIHEWLSARGDADKPGMQVSGISCWANVLRYGEGIAIHHHDPAFVSAHYTVQSGLEDGDNARTPDSGATVYFRPGFIDRRHGGQAAMAPSPWDDDWRIEKPPVEGHLFFFPSFIRHEVRPYLGPTQRISIAMDVFFKCQTLPMYFGGPRWFIPK